MCAAINAPSRRTHQINLVFIRFDDHDGLLPRQWRLFPGQLRRNPSVREAALTRIDDVSNRLTATSIRLLEHYDVDIGHTDATNRVIRLCLTRLSIEACVRVVEDDRLLELGIGTAHV